jgi:putative hydrolase of the HAD superfamily
MEENSSNKIDVVLFDFGGVLAEEGWKQGFRVIADRKSVV